MDVHDWLRGLGLSQYEAVFRENGVDAEVLADLTDADLEKLGVLLGHRKRFLKAVAGLKSADTEAVPSRPGAKAEPKPLDAAERRQLTVMFCDLVGSTAMSARLDPEDMRGVIGAYHKCCATLIASNGGFVAKYMGDGVLAYFGYPKAHEHDAERAVRAGLAIVEAPAKLETAASTPLHVRVGIATGIVVVGDLIGSGESQERGVVGDTPNLAARLQSIAPPDGVLIAESTRKLVGDLFELEDLGTRNLKGVASPVRAFAALREKAIESRFEALHAGELPEIVGRGQETDVLLQSWAQAKSGAGQVVLLAGEAGIGKSRLAAAFLARLADESMRLRYFSSPQHTDSALYPVIRQIEWAAGLRREDAAKTKLDKLDATLAGWAVSPENAALIAALLSLQNDGRYPAIELPPPVQREKTLEALLGWAEPVARKTPLLMVFEDAHWADPSTLEWLGRLVDRVRSLRVLLLVTSRPEFAAPWIGHTHVKVLTLDRLSPDEVDALVDLVVGNKRLAPNLRKDIIERVDGVPLFAEEITKAVLEAESEVAGEKTLALVPSQAHAIPATLHASLMARLDRLGDAKAVAQIGAAIGREFSHQLLSSVARETEAELADALDRLVDSGLLLRRAASAQASYLFKHALVQDAAYGTLLREPRRALHARIAEVFETQFPEVAETQPELLARHFTEAGLIESAVAYWHKAGQRSFIRSALAEAVEQLRRGLALVERAPSTPALRRARINLQVALIPPLVHVEGYSSPAVSAATESAQRLMDEAKARGEPPEDPLLLFTVLYGVLVSKLIAFDGRATLDLADSTLALAEKTDELAVITQFASMNGTANFLAGNIPMARERLDRAHALFDAARSRHIAARFGEGAALTPNFLFRAAALWVLGYPDRARNDVNLALEEAGKAAQTSSQFIAFTGACLLAAWLGDYAGGESVGDEFVVLAEEKDLPFWRAVGFCSRALIVLAGRPDDGVRLMSEALAALRPLGATIFTPLYFAALAEAHAALGQIEAATHRIGEAFSVINSTGERWSEAEAHRVAGEIALKSPGPDAAKAEACFARALEVARSQEARGWELRAAMSVARIRRDQGRSVEGRALLAPVYDWFTEGFDSRDLKEAKALLGELA